MSDNKKIVGNPDRRLLNIHEPYEVETAVNDIVKELPTAKRSDIQKALLESAKVENFHHNRAMILNSAKLKLGKQKK